ncbi:MAG: AsmA-like C-terminal region-containing protein [Elusimicrobiota bacterium]
MKKLFKIAAAFAAIAVVLLAAAAVAIRIYLPPEKLKALAISQADKSLHRTLEVQSVKFGLLSGLSIRGLRLSETPNFSKGEFLTADSFTLSPEWLPLLHKEVVARKIELSGAIVTVVKGADGRFNFSDLTTAPVEKKAGRSAKTVSAGPASQAAPAALAVAVDSLRLKDVALHYADKQQGAKADLTLNGVEVDGFSLSGPFSLTLDVKADYAAAGKRYSGSFKAKGRANLGGGDQSRASADFSSLVLATQGKEVSGSLRFENANAPKISLQLRAPAMDAKFLNSSLGGAVVPDGTAVPAMEAAASLSYNPPMLDVSSFKFSAGGLDIAGSASVADINAKTPKLKLEAASNEFKLAPLLDILPQFRGAGLDGKASLKISAASEAGGVLVLKLLELRLGGMDAKASGTVSGIGAKTQAFNLKLETNRFSLSSLAEGVESMKQFALNGDVALSASASGTAASPKASGSLTLDSVAAKYQGQVLEKITGNILFTQDSVNMPQLTGRLNGGDFKLKVAASNGPAPVATVSGWLSLLDLGALQKLSAGQTPSAPAAAPARGASASSAPSEAKAPASGPPLKTSGDITVDKTTHPNFECGKMTLNWNLTGVAADMSRLAGTAKLSVGPGKATKILDLAAARGGLVRAMVVPLMALQKAGGLHIPGLNVPDMQNIPFTRIEGDYSAAQGVITMKPFLLDSPVIGMNTTGTVDMGAQTANLMTAVKTSLGEIDLAITGPFSNISVRPNMSQQLQSTGKQLLQNQGKALLNKFLHR